MLIFTSHVERKASFFRPRDKAIDRIEAFLVRTAVVIDDGLPKMC